MRFVVFLLCVVGCVIGGAIERPLAAEVVDRVLAVVGDDIVTLSDLKRFRQSPGFESRIVEKTTSDPLEILIRTRLLKKEIGNLNLEVSEADVNSAVQDVIVRNRITMEILREGLASQGQSLEGYKRELRDQIKQMKFMGQVIFPRIHLSEEEISRKTGAKASEEAKLRARMELFQARAPAELAKYIEELRSKVYVEIKK